MARALSMFSTMELSIDDGFLAEEGQSEGEIWAIRLNCAGYV
jgi:hypothetical protein